VVVIQQELHAELLRILGECDRVVEVVRQLGWRVKESQSRPAVTMLLQDLQAGFALPAILKDHALLFGLSQERNVSTNRVVTGAKRSRNSQGNEQHTRADRVRSFHGDSSVRSVAIVPVG